MAVQENKNSTLGRTWLPANQPFETTITAWLKTVPVTDSMSVSSGAASLLAGPVRSCFISLQQG